MTDPVLVDRETWLAARQSLLAREKELTRQQDLLAASRQALPAVRITTDYTFATERGPQSLDDLFNGKSQLLIYHFMFGESWSEGCPGCSFWADSFNGAIPHLAARDTALTCASTAALDKLLAYRDRMGWQFDWVSSASSTFNSDFGVCLPEDEHRSGPRYNYNSGSYGEELPGLSAFVRLADGSIAHTYSCYARGMETVNSAYQLLDLSFKGRQESGLEYPQAWVRRHDCYG